MMLSRGDPFHLNNNEASRAFVLAVKVIFVIKRWGVLSPYLTNKQWGQRPRILSLTVIIACHAGKLIECFLSQCQCESPNIFTKSK